MKYVLTLDLKDDPQLIKEYDKYHERIPIAIEKSIKDAGVINLEIFRLETRMTMIMEVTDDFSFAKKAEMDAANTEVQIWEKLMWKFQKALPWAKPGEKWMMMDQIFSL